MNAVIIDTCGKCGHLYFPGDDVFETRDGLVICAQCEESKISIPA